MKGKQMENNKVTFWSYFEMITDEENRSEADVYHRITLEPGETFRVSIGGTHEEGYCTEHITYTHECTYIRREIFTQSRDCDGRHNDFRTLVCNLDKLESYKNGSGIMIPDWELVSNSQRDYTAEAAGY